MSLLAVSGCGGPNAADVALITGNPQATTSPAPINPPGTASPTPLPTPGAPAALRFIGAQPDTIGVRGSGLPEQSTLTFQVTDAFGTPVGGVTVSFSLSQVADESIAPSEGVTGADGNVQVVLTSGERTASVQITAEVDSVSPPLIVSSTAVVILGAPPSQLHFSLAHQFHNISGRVTFGLTDQITAFVGDRFGNPVPPGTAVSFTTNGGVIGNPMTTNTLGQATATLVSQAPVPSNGIVSTLATTHGERPFIDTNGNGACDAGEEVLAVAEPFYDANCNGQYDAGEDFIDLNGDQQFNADQGSGTRACSDQVIISDSICTTFSANTVVQLVPSGSGPIPAGGARGYTLTVSDIDGNPIVGGSTVNIAVGGRAKLLGPTSFSIADAQTFGQFVEGVNRFQFSVTDNAPTSQTSETDAVTVTVTSQSLAAGGNGSVIVTDLITFLAVPTPTPTPTFIPTLTPTPTVTPTPTITPTPTPAGVHLQVALFVNQAASNGDGTLSTVISALVTDATGAAVGNGTVVLFGLVAPVPAGVSVTSPGFTGQAAPCTLGFPVVAQPGDALSCIKYDQARAGQTVTIRAAVQNPSGALSDTQVITLPDLRTATPTSTPSFTATPTSTSTPTPTPPAMHIQVALFVNQASSNGDGTLSSVISALVTDATGAVVGNGVPVQFSLLAPVPAGVSVTSPGLTGQAAPCTLGFPVSPQPGDALSCVKYDTARQGETVTVQASVDTPSGPLTSTQVITLPDLRPTATATVTPTPTPTETPTPTVTPTSTPAAMHIEVALFVNQAGNNGDGTLSAVISALVTDATGATVGNGIPVQFSLVAPVPSGVSVTSPGITGQAAPCTLGFPVLPQPGDALSCVKYNQARQGQMVTVQALVQTPSGPLTDTQVITLPDLRTATPTNTPTLTPTPTATETPTPTPAAAHIQVALFVNQASSNGDGTLSSVISALVTDQTGAVVGSGVQVQFSLLAPVPSGVSVTSPGFTGQAAPCTLGFPVLAQPGDALSCVKYDTARQGQTVTVQALVQTPSGPLTSTQVITLPDVRPTATPTNTSTPTSTPTPTATPAAAHIQVALFVNQASSNGDGTLSTVISALVTDQTGAVVGNGVPVQFSLLAPVPSGVSVTSPGLTGQAAPCTLGFPVLAQPGDALSCVKYDSARQGQTVTVQALVQTPSGPLTDTQVITLPDVRPTATPTRTPTPTPTQTATATQAAAHIQVALFVNQASSNGDGTLSSVISALVTDQTGAVVGNGVPVQFSLLPPVPAGVSVTSPGFTGQAAPCTLGFPVLAQPGDALSCVKYDSARQGQTITVQALVQTPSGPLTSTQVITLPDLRTATPTNTRTPTPTPTPTATPTPTPAAAHIVLALFVNQASPNGDGTLSTVISALVTDTTGAAVPNGIAVQFSLVSPPPGVSVTSPGFTGQDPPCTLGFPVQAQPGDALSCIKYDQARQGQAVTVQASVSVPVGPPLTTTQVITLPDLRPTATPTRTSTPTPTATPTPTQAAAHIALALFVNKGCSNQDGTVSSVLSAVVTDVNGAAVSDGVPVQFVLLPVVPAGVAVTSPGLTGAEVPCVLTCLVVPAQPGDALSCIKYDQARVGQSVTVRASVPVPSGTPLATTQSITLPAPSP